MGVRCIDGARDLIVAADAENPLGLVPSRAKDGAIVQKKHKLRLDGELCLVRTDAAGKVTRIALCRGRGVRSGDVELNLKQETDFIEVRLEGENAVVASGNRDSIREVTIGGQRVPVR